MVDSVIVFFSDTLKVVNDTKANSTFSNFMPFINLTLGALLGIMVFGIQEKIKQAKQEKKELSQRIITKGIEPILGFISTILRFLKRSTIIRRIEKPCEVNILSYHANFINIDEYFTFLNKIDPKNLKLYTLFENVLMPIEEGIYIQLNASEEYKINTDDPFLKRLNSAKIFFTDYFMILNELKNNIQNEQIGRSFFSRHKRKAIITEDIQKKISTDYRKLVIRDKNHE